MDKATPRIKKKNERDRKQREDEGNENAGSNKGN